MPAPDWLTLDQVLGYAEVVLVGASLAYLVVAALRGGRGRSVRALVLAGVVAVTVAQPFGVRAVPITARQFAAAEPTPHAQATHSIDVLGLPLFGFVPYTRDIVSVQGETGDPTQWLKVRSWLWPGLLTNASKITRLCGPTSQLCWTPEDSAVGAGRSSNLHLARAGDQWLYRVLTRNGSPAPYGGTNGGTYRVAVGIASFSGLTYWLVVGVLGAGVLIRRRRWVTVRA
jgi:hypothetical protein